MYLSHSFLSLASSVNASALLSAFWLWTHTHTRIYILLCYIYNLKISCVDGSHDLFIVIALKISLLGCISDHWDEAGVFSKWCWTIG